MECSIGYSHMHSIKYSVWYSIGYIQGIQGASYIRGILWGIPDVF